MRPPDRRSNQQAGLRACGMRDVKHLPQHSSDSSNMEGRSLSSRRFRLPDHHRRLPAATLQALPSISLLHAGRRTDPDTAVFSHTPLEAIRSDSAAATTTLRVGTFRLTSAGRARIVRSLSCERDPGERDHPTAPRSAHESNCRPDRRTLVA